MNRESRTFFRVSATVPLFSRAVTETRPGRLRAQLLDEGFSLSMQEQLRQTINISAAGIYFTSPRSYKAGEMIEVRLMLEAVHKGLLVLFGEVVRAETLENAFGIAIKFVNADQRITELIARFVLERERQLIKEKRVGWI